MIFLDTHTWYWWLAIPERLSERAHSAIEKAQSIGVSVMSCYELVVLVQRKRIAIDRAADTWVRQALSAPGTVVVDLHPSLAVAAAQLGPEFPGDPFDRVIYVSAREHRAPLVTKDRHLREADPERTVW